jgi:hypothetical protein
MFQRVLAAYQRITQVAGKPRANRQFAVLNVVALEERTTPAVPQALLAPIAPPQAVLLVTAPTTTAPAAPAVRSDLFGAGGVENADHPDDLETLLTNDQPPQEKSVNNAKPPVAADSDAGETVVIEDMVFVPCVE